MEPLRYGHLSAFVIFRARKTYKVRELPERDTAKASNTAYITNRFSSSLPAAWPAMACRVGGTCVPERVWVISIARLCMLPYLHLRPIDVIVFDDPYMEILS